MDTIKFPWNMSKWDQTSELFKKWPFAHTDIGYRRQYLDIMFELMKIPKPTKLRLMTEKFIGPNGPMDLMIMSVLKGSQIFESGLKATKADVADVINISKRKVFVLMVCGFFGLIPNFCLEQMFSNEEFTRCLLAYFEFVWRKSLTDASWLDRRVRVDRRVGGRSVRLPDWSQSTNRLAQRLRIENKKVGIEDFRNCTQVNFADPKPGGTLPSDCGDVVQEEILFLIYPELFVTVLLVPPIRKTEAIVVSGVTRINNYVGYKQTFKYAGPFVADQNDITILFMDAVPVGDKGLGSALQADMNKAFVGFSGCDPTKYIATGHWGCGAFGGDAALKSVVQLLACSEAQRELIYVMFGEPIDGFEEFYQRLIELNIEVRDVYNGLIYALKNYPTEPYKGILKYIDRTRR